MTVLMMKYKVELKNKITHEVYESHLDLTYKQGQKLMLDIAYKMNDAHQYVEMRSV
jgi:hypothetical protein